jgi:hypothetical protein
MACRTVSLDDSRTFQNNWVVADLLLVWRAAMYETPDGVGPLLQRSAIAKARYRKGPLSQRPAIANFGSLSQKFGPLSQKVYLTGAAIAKARYRKKMFARTVYTRYRKGPLSQRPAITKAPYRKWHINLGDVTSCHDIACHVLLCPVMSCDVMTRHVMSCHVMTCHVTTWHVLSCHDMTWHDMTGNVLTWHDISCLVMTPAHYIPRVRYTQGPLPHIYDTYMTDIWHGVPTDKYVHHFHLTFRLPTLFVTRTTKSYMSIYGSYRSYMGHIWVYTIYGSYMGYMWYTWVIYRSSMGHIWVYMGHIWYIWVIYGQYMAYMGHIWAIYGIYGS